MKRGEVGSLRLLLDVKSWCDVRRAEAGSRSRREKAGTYEKEGLMSAEDENDRVQRKGMKMRRGRQD